MNLETLKGKTLDDETFAKLHAYVEDLTGARDAAKQESIEGRKKLKAEVEQLRAVKATLFEKLGIDEDVDLDALEVKGQAEAAKQFETKLKRLEREKADALAKAGEIEGKWKSSRLDAALEKALSSHEFIDRDLVASFIAKQVQWEDDQVLVKAGDKLVPLEDGVKHFAQTKPHLLKAQGGAKGSGTPPGAGSGGGNRMTSAEFENLRPAERAKAMASGISITD